MKTDEQIVVVTGANTGIGFATACAARAGKHEHDPCLPGPAQRKSGAFGNRENRGHGPLSFCRGLRPAVLHSGSVSKATRALPRIDVLINNAGAAFARRELTPEGIERTFAINHLAPFLLTHLVLDQIRSAPTGRIVNLTAGMPVLCSSFLDNLQGEKHCQFNAYRSSKIGNILFTYELARRLSGIGITVNCTRDPFGASSRKKREVLFG